MSILKDKVIVVLGASSGIGEACSKYFAENGAKVFIAARREERLIAIKNEVQSKNGIMEYMVCDAVDFNSVQKLGDAAVEKFGDIDVWFNCCGQNKSIGNFWEIDMNCSWQEVEVDLKSTFNGTHVAINKMIKKDSGIILNFCGGGTCHPHLYAAAYSSAKTAIARFTEAVYLELEQQNSNINLLCATPGLVHNERTQLLCDDEHSKKYMPDIGAIFARGGGQSPLNTAYLVEKALEGKLDAYKGRFVYGNNLEKALENAPTIKGTDKGLLRMV